VFPSPLKGTPSTRHHQLIKRLILASSTFFMHCVLICVLAVGALPADIYRPQTLDRFLDPIMENRFYIRRPQPSVRVREEVDPPLIMNDEGPDVANLPFYYPVPTFKNPGIKDGDILNAASAQ
jgi:hypothetical protein